MSLNLDLLEILMEFNEKNSPEYLLYINDDTFPITCVSITNSPTPVNEPTTRGGVYFSEKFAYKLKGMIKAQQKDVSDSLHYLHQAIQINPKYAQMSESEPSFKEVLSKD